MRGLPYHFGTETDIKNCMNIDPKGTLPMLKRLRDGRFSWVRVAWLAENDPGLTDAMHKVQLEPDPNFEGNMMDAPVVKAQYEFQEDSKSELCRVFKFELTVSEALAKINSYIADCEARAA
jgi:hypothetical protein